MKTNPVNVSPYVVKVDDPKASIQKATEDLLSVGKGGDGAVFSPLESVSAGIRAGNAVIQLLKITLLWLGRGIIAPAEVLLRKRFGERYFNYSVIVSAFVATVSASILLKLDEAITTAIFSGFCALCGLNALVCFNRDRRGDYWHSYSEGESLIRFASIDERLAKKFFAFDLSKLFFEPLFFGATGFFALFNLPATNLRIAGMRTGYWVSPVGVYILVVAATMFLYQLYCYIYRRNLILDEKDAGVIAEARLLSSTGVSRTGVNHHRGVAFISLGEKKPDWS